MTNILRMQLTFNERHRSNNANGFPEEPLDAFQMVICNLNATKPLACKWHGDPNDSHTLYTTAARSTRFGKSWGLKWTLQDKKQTSEMCYPVKRDIYKGVVQIFTIWAYLTYSCRFTDVRRVPGLPLFIIFSRISWIFASNWLYSVRGRQKYNAIKKTSRTQGNHALRSADKITKQERRSEGLAAICKLFSILELYVHQHML